MLQRTTLTMSGVRRLFDHVISTYPVMKSRLDPQARIVKYPELESVIAKLQRHKTLSTSERQACAPFEASVTCRDENTTESSFVASAFTKRKAPKGSQYVDAERMRALISTVKLIYTDLRNRMDASLLEKLMFLMYNRSFCDVLLVEAIRSEQRLRYYNYFSY
ncbi:hypothetical protein PI125_g19000 [Phytophthora idaei]|nr:hypothetical protein PI125_g19000 [Phytophthora idaei]